MITPPSTFAEIFAENRKPVTYRSFGKMMDDLNAQYVGVLKNYKERVEALEQRIAQVEGRPLQKWAGVHSEGTMYAEASLATRAGSLWVATKATTTTPGTPGCDWTLIVKRGSFDSKDAR